MITIFLKTYRDHWKALIAWALTLIGLVSIQMSIYPTLVKSGAAINEFLDAYPDAIKKIFRMQDYTSGPGFLSTELYSMMVPLVLLAVGASWGASATAHEEDKGTADTLFTLPISRLRIMLSKIAATTSSIIALALLAMSTILALRAWVDMEISSSALLAGTVMSVGIALFFTSFSFLVGALSSHKGIPLGAATGFSLICFVLYSIAGLVDSIDWLEPYNPMEWGLGSNPLFDGISWIAMGKLYGGSAVLFAVTIVIFNRKDIHTP